MESMLVLRTANKDTKCIIENVEYDPYFIPLNLNLAKAFKDDFFKKIVEKNKNENGLYSSIHDIININDNFIKDVKNDEYENDISSIQDYTYTFHYYESADDDLGAPLFSVNDEAHDFTNYLKHVYYITKDVPIDAINEAKDFLKETTTKFMKQYVPILLIDNNVNALFRGLFRDMNNDYIKIGTSPYRQKGLAYLTSDSYIESKCFLVHELIALSLNYYVNNLSVGEIRIIYGIPVISDTLACIIYYFILKKYDVMSFLWDVSVKRKIITNIKELPLEIFTTERIITKSYTSDGFQININTARNRALHAVLYLDANAFKTVNVSLSDDFIPIKTLEISSDVSVIIYEDTSAKSGSSLVYDSKGNDIFVKMIYGNEKYCYSIFEDGLIQLMTTCSELYNQSITGEGPSDDSKRCNYKDEIEILERTNIPLKLFDRIRKISPALCFLLDAIMEGSDSMKMVDTWLQSNKRILELPDGLKMCLPLLLLSLG